MNNIDEKKVADAVRNLKLGDKMRKEIWENWQNSREMEGSYLYNKLAEEAKAFLANPESVDTAAEEIQELRDDFQAFVKSRANPNDPS